jgi:hypothetical protein
VDVILAIWAFVVVVVSHPVFALVVGTFLAVVVPYARAVLDAAAERGTFEGLDMPFDWRYLAMFLTPLAEMAIVLITTQGMWVIVSGWGWTYAAMLGYSGSDIVKEMAKAGRAIRKISGRDFRSGRIRHQSLE